LTNEKLIGNINAKIIRVVEELIGVVQFVISINYKFTRNSPEINEKIAKMPSILIELCMLSLEGHFNQLSKRYLSSITPIFATLKW
jgi:hypothetical protein